MPDPETCDACNGIGESRDQVTCWKCNGSGEIDEDAGDNFAEPDEDQPDEARDWGGID